jgi:(E)-4-hydroxy-3-methylbut-2-enyl-diphosphate synthase
VVFPAVAARIHRSLLDEPRALEILWPAVDRLDLELPPGIGQGTTAVRFLDRLPPAGCPVLLEGRIALGVDPVESVEQLVDLAWHARSRGLSVAVSLQCARGTGSIAAYRCLAARLDERDLDLVLVLRDDLSNGEDPHLDPSRRLGSLLIDGLGDAIRLHGLSPPWSALERSYDILQATRRRISRVEYISCPSCGRTLFDLEQVTAEVRSRTAHLRDIKIAIMGCVVNGPGEMADADFGYVGCGPGRVALYRGRECLEKDVPAEEATQRLVELIRRAGRWRDPPSDRPAR